MAPDGGIASILEQVKPEGDHPGGTKTHGAEIGGKKQTTPVEKGNTTGKGKKINIKYKAAPKKSVGNECDKDLVGLMDAKDDKDGVPDENIAASVFKGKTDKPDWGLGNMWRTRMDNGDKTWCSPEVYKEAKDDMEGEQVYMAEGTDVYVQWEFAAVKKITAMRIAGFHNNSLKGPNHWMVERFKLRYKKALNPTPFGENATANATTAKPTAAEAEEDEWEWYDNARLLMGVRSTEQAADLLLTPFLTDVIRLYPTRCGIGIFCCLRATFLGCVPPPPKKNPFQQAAEHKKREMTACEKSVTWKMLCITGASSIVLTCILMGWLLRGVIKLLPDKKVVEKEEEEARAQEEEDAKPQTETF